MNIWSYINTYMLHLSWLQSRPLFPDCLTLSNAKYHRILTLSMSKLTSTCVNRTTPRHMSSLPDFGFVHAVFVPVICNLFLFLFVLIVLFILVDIIFHRLFPIPLYCDICKFKVHSNLLFSYSFKYNIWWSPC